jgi:prepilin-type N-terminal cleavage/methylation domain-containing protein
MMKGAAMRSGHPTTRAFTLAEVLVVIVVIGILATLIIVAVNAAGSKARTAAERTTVRNLGLAAEQFRAEAGFGVPLVLDGIQGASAGAMDVEPVVIDRAGQTASEPVFAPAANPLARLTAVYNPRFAQNRRFLEGIDPLGSGAPSRQELIDRYEAGTPECRAGNQRYSKYALSYYLMGALPSAVDGVDGPGMVEPRADGRFEEVVAEGPDVLSDTSGRSPSRERYEPFFNAGGGSARLVREYFDPDEYIENAGDPDAAPADPSDQTDWRHAAIVDSDGKAYRLYRWAPLSSAYGIGTGATHQLNIPAVLVDEEKRQEMLDAGDPEAASGIDLTAGNAALRGATWAVVGAGANGLFGSEPMEMLRERLEIKPGMQAWEIRALAKSDNLVEVGR